jgi:hypothetical protein
MSKHTILFLAANPIGTDRLDLDEEARAIADELTRGDHRDRFELATRWAVQPLDLLRELRKLRPTVLHFSGHGSRHASGGHRSRAARRDVTPQPVPGGEPQSGLLFHGSDGRARLVSSSALHQALTSAGSSVRIVVLSACYSEPQAEAVLSHVDCVVGIHGSIGDDAARSFAIGFYGALADRASLASAFRQGRAAISLEGLSEGDRLQLRVRDGVDAERLVLASDELPPAVRDAAHALELAFCAAPSRLPWKHNTRAFEGRGEELAELDRAWDDGRTRIVVVTAIGGAGKSTMVARWKSELLSRDNHGGVERYFDWSFYHQGTSNGVSSQAFIAAALAFFGERGGDARGSPWEQGERLAELVAARRSLLVLDGLEPLQAAPDHTGDGELKDDALRALLGKLAANNPGMCVVTTRTGIRDVINWGEHTVRHCKLRPLSDPAGAAVLRRLGVQGPQTELELASREVRGHALTLTLMGSYFRVRFHEDPDIARRHCFGFKQADDRIQGGHAFRVVAAYERLFEDSDRHVELAILRLLGLFDRPAPPDCIAVLRAAAIPDLTDRLVDVRDDDWHAAVAQLKELDLLQAVVWQQPPIFGFSERTARHAMAAGQRNEHVVLGEPNERSELAAMMHDGFALDAHPLLRAYFAHRIAGPAARAAHGRLYEHLSRSVPYWPDGQDGIYVLYHAIAHACEAGRHQEAYDQVFDDRIQRGIVGAHAFYSRTKLALVGADLVALGQFFVEPWSKVVPTLDAAAQQRLLTEVGFRLRTSVRLREAQAPLQLGMRLAHEERSWGRLARYACTLSEIKLLLGEVAAAVEAAADAVAYAEQSGDRRQCVVRRATHADALHQAGRPADSVRIFAEAEALHAKDGGMPPLLDGLRSSQFCDVLLRVTEQTAWRAVLDPPAWSPCDVSCAELIATMDTVERRVRETLAAATQSQALLDLALDHLTLGRIQLYRAVLASGSAAAPVAVAGARRDLDVALTTLRRAGRQDYLPAVLVSSAWQHATAARVDDARQALQDAGALASRGGMRLHLADVHLHRARLFGRPDELASARKLIVQCGYLRRIPELEDAERVAAAW